MSEPRKRPPEYGQWWNRNGLGEQWYQDIHSLRRRAHEFFLDWFCRVQRDGAATRTILEVGCGRGVPYADLFRDYEYYGTDISEKEIAFCRESYGAERFFVGDAVEADLRGPYDLVFSHAVIDHVYDIDAFLQRVARASRGWVYVTAYAGWHPRLARHLYRWDAKVTCFHNEVSPEQARAALAAVGCTAIEVFPAFVDNKVDEVPFETVILAHAPGD